jgi:hypothetical protein
MKKHILKSKNNLINRIWTLLNQPFPEETDTYSVLKQGALVGLFIFLFLKFVQPFDIQNAGSRITTLSFYFAAVTFAVIVLYDFLLIYILKIKRNLPSWTFIKWICSVLVLLFFISLANFYLMSVINNGSLFSLRYLLNSFYVTSIVGVFPIVFFGALKLNKHKTANEKIASSIVIKDIEEMNVGEVLSIDANGDIFNIKTEDFLYAQSMQNYVTLFYKMNDGDIQKSIIRSTLTALISQISSGQILQSHRSYIVNKGKIEKVTGNAQGLKLYLKDTEFVVPVSRKYISFFR